MTAIFPTGYTASPSICPATGAGSPVRSCPRRATSRSTRRAPLRGTTMTWRNCIPGRTGCGWRISGYGPSGRPPSGRPFTNSTSRMQGGRRTCFSGSHPKARSMSAVTGSFRAGKRSIMPANISMPSPTGLSIAPARVAGSGFPRRDRRRAAMSAPGSLPRQGSARCASG